MMMIRIWIERGWIGSVGVVLQTEKTNEKGQDK